MKIQTHTHLHIHIYPHVDVLEKTVLYTYGNTVGFLSNNIFVFTIGLYIKTFYFCGEWKSKNVSKMYLVGKLCQGRHCVFVSGLHLLCLLQNFSLVCSLLFFEFILNSLF